MPFSRAETPSPEHTGPEETDLIGQTLSHYRITAAIGAGGMGEVYRSTDTRLGREVALKLLPKAFAADPERLARFDREARLLASLNHPNIAQLYGFDTASLDDGTVVHVIAMELVEGEDLAERLKRGPVPLDEAIAIAKQMAEALEGAHEKGIVHRDLKPANVTLTPDGKVKVLDFGLAKTWTGDGVGGTSSADLSHSPTLAHPGSAAGLILGTAAYMSPEQARGRTVDKRADVWAFGVVLWEMLTSQRLFSGETVSDVLAAVLTREPDWKALPASTPPGLRRLLRHCLERDPRRRLRDIADSHVDLEDSLRPRSDDGAIRPEGGLPGRRPPIRWLAGAAALTLLGILVGALAARRMSPSLAPAAVRLATVLPAGEDLMQQASGFAISPDGTRVVFRHGQDGQRGLFLRALDQLEPSFIPGSEEGTGPLFSPDGRSLAFFSMPVGARAGGLYRIKIEGGAPFHLAETGTREAGFTFSGHWTGDGQILFCGSSGAIQRVPAAGGPATAVTTLDEARAEQRHSQPRALPRGRGVLYVAIAAGGRQDVMVAPGDGSKGRVLVERATSPRFSPTGHLLFVLEATLFAAPFDLDRLKLTGAPVALVEGLEVAVYANYRLAKFDLADNGTLAYLVGGPSSRIGNLVLVDRQGKASLAFAETGTYLAPRLSPDGGRIAYAAVDPRSGERDIWIGDVKRGTRTRLTLGKGASTDPVWSPDGSLIAFGSNREEGLFNVFSVPSDGSAEPTRLSRTVDRERDVFPRLWLRDSSGLVFQAIKAADDIGIWRNGSGAEEMLLATSFAELEPSLSPDERLMAYVSDESGRREVYVRDMGGAGRRVQVSSEGGDEPVWSPRGGEIFYRRGPRMIAVPVSTRAEVTLGAPSVLFEGSFDVDPFGSDTTNYDVTKDGQRFVMVRRTTDPGRSRQQLTVVVNWTEELKRAAGAQ